MPTILGPFFTQTHCLHHALKSPSKSKGEIETNTPVDDDKDQVDKNDEIFCKQIIDENNEHFIQLPILQL